MAELTQVDVEALVRDARAGDSSALGQLYDTYRDRVARFATGRIGDAERAEDVTSETFEAVLRGLAAYRPGTDFEAWLFTIAHRRVSDHFRRQTRRREVELDEGAQPAGSMSRNSSWVAGCQLQRRLWARTRSGLRASGTVGSTVNRCRGLMVERSYKCGPRAGAGRPHRSGRTVTTAS